MAKVAEPEPADDPLKRAFKFMSGRISDDGDIADSLGELWDTDYPAFEAAHGYFVNLSRDASLRLLGFDVGPRATDPEYAHLPKELRQVAVDMDPSIWQRLQHADDDEQIFHLSNMARVQEAERAEFERREQIKIRVREQGNSAIEQFSAVAEKQYREVLKDFRPFDNEQHNAGAHRALCQFVFDTMMADEQYARLREDIARCLREVPEYLAKGDAVEAETSRQAAIFGAAQFSKAFKETLKPYRDWLVNDSRDAKLLRELQASMPPEEWKGLVQRIKAKEQPAPLPTGDASPPPGQRFGLSDERKRALAEDLKRRRAVQ
jgi:hypothetical protein